MKTIPRSVLLLFCSLLLASCVGQSIHTSSGRPEVTVDPPISKAQNVAIEKMTMDGFTLTNQTQNSLTFERDLPPAQAAIFLVGIGNSYHSRPKAVIRLTFIPTSGKVRVLGTVHAFTQGPFGQIKTLDITGGKSAHELQSSLEAIKQRVGQ